MIFKQNLWSVVWPALVPFFGISLLVEMLVHFGFVSDYLLPAPSSVLVSLLENRSEFFIAFCSTGFSALMGLLISFVVGVLLALLLSFSKFAKRALLPYAVFFQTVPIIAVAPLLVVWFGFGVPTVIAAASIVSIFPILASALLGLESVSPEQLDLFNLYGANARDLLFKLRVPNATPQVFSGLRIAAGLAVIGSIVGEFIAGGGLGSVVDAARTQQKTEKVFAAVLVSSVLGFVFVSLIDLASHFQLKRWRGAKF